MTARLGALLAAGATGALAVLALHAFPPGAGSIWPGCLFHQLTGLFCPGCGSTRALHALSHGDLGTAWRMNPLLVVSVPFLPVLAARAANWPPRLPPAMLLLTDARPWAVAVTVYFVLRNLPFWPFLALAPG